MTNPGIAPAAPLFEGHQPRRCGAHRTVGPHKAWCHDCRAWCYPDDPCHECGPTHEQIVADARADERDARNAAYAERDRLVAALSKCFPSHLTRHEGDDWEDDWRNIVCIHLPAGQATWHIHDSELPWFTHLNLQAAHWDGHSTDEKYQRLADLLDGDTR
jgi:hypothetical protein